MRIITGCALLLMTLHANAVETELVEPILNDQQQDNYVQEPIYVEGIKLYYPDLVAKFDQLETPLWIEPDNRFLLEVQLDVVALSGVSPVIKTRSEQLKQFAKEENWIAYDLLASDTLLLYVSYTENISEMGQEWFYESPMVKQTTAPSKDAVLALEKAVEMNALSQFIEYYRAPHIDYDDIDIALNDLRQYLTESVPLVGYDGLKRTGDLLPERDIIIERISMAAVDTSMVTPDLDWYDESLEAAILEFQRIHGLKQDGVIGPKTTKWFNVSPRYRMTKLALNVERSRLWNKGNATQIVVNVPSFEMRYSHSGEQVFESKVVVGKLRRPTPIMQIHMQSVVLNPTWNIPWKIMVEDIVPKAKRDPSYLQRQGIDILESWTSNRIIPYESINWATMNPRSFPYRMRQRSGYKNALGLYKFNTPNARAIYLHDTPSKNLFNQDMRAFSSGCIRVEHAEEFAEVLLDYQGIERNRLSTARSNKHIQFNQQIPVFIIYQTAWLENGEVHYRDDIYDLDSPYMASHPRTLEIVSVTPKR
ncbi:L,D-transpeptidase family protein [Vibrio agarivorans]|uniref:L,D-transpeptidase family protein n=1 Tax=Vibrio agarivorans TaxID=153622 RepID=UPI0025B49E9A|nr:L,D-transpeptidase family protein [Vibrio agarivorans]MDN3663645.1 L,D-transpeptidase family protein [Vibrio agarivorans]